MIWFLVLGGILLIVLGVWGGPRRRRRPDKAARIPKEATVQEAWDILTAPVEYDEELIKIPEHKPWYVPGGDRRFHQGLLVGLGLGLMLAAILFPFLPQREAPGEQLASDPPAAQAEQPKADPPADAPPATQPPATQPPGTQPPVTQPPAPTTPPPQPANVTFTVEPGSSSQEIAANLKAAGLINDEEEFLKLVVAYGVETRLQAGTFVIPTDASVDKVLETLTQ
ncbi:MAG: hypothetical protein ACOY94_09640 [Bacillota bacterium]